MTAIKTHLNQKTSFTILLLLFCLFAINGQNNNQATNRFVSDFDNKIAVNSINLSNSKELDDNIRSIFHDTKGNYWFGTNDAGVYRYDGKSLVQFTVKDGLSNNQVQSIQEDKDGNIWFGTGLFNVSRFDRRSFTTFTKKEEFPFMAEDNHGWKLSQTDLWFYAGSGVYRYSDNSFVYLPLDNIQNKETQSSPFNLSRYAVYCLLKDKKGNMWFGTQAQGVCHYDGKSITWFKEKGLSGPAVLGIFEDSKGNLWFGNNGAGLFRYDGKILTNFTEENGLGNKDFIASGKSNPGTLARIYTINEDNYGNLWIGTVDSGVWRYDGKNLINYTTTDGLASNAVNTIYKDRNGDLWFGTDGDGICKFNGLTFEKFRIN